MKLNEELRPAKVLEKYLIDNEITVPQNVANILEHPISTEGITELKFFFSPMSVNIDKIIASWDRHISSLISNYEIKESEQGGLTEGEEAYLESLYDELHDAVPENVSRLLASVEEARKGGTVSAEEIFKEFGI